MSNYCVYLHRNKRTNVVFYIGSGRVTRSSARSGRSKEWWDIVRQDDFIVEIIGNDLSKKSSLEEERFLYSQYVDSGTLVNKRIPGNLKESCIISLREKFYYDETSPTCLRFKEDVFKGRKYANKAACKDDVAGCNTDTTRGITVGGFVYPLYRVIWMVCFGEIPDGHIVDHIDGDVRNNKTSNLRVISQKLNTRNRKKPSTNTSGVAGVNLMLYKGVRDRWCAAYADDNGKRRMKYFSIKKLGDSEAFRLACEWRAEQIKLLNEQGAGYTERHGT